MPFTVKHIGTAEVFICATASDALNKILKLEEQQSIHDVEIKDAVGETISFDQLSALVEASEDDT